MLVKFIKRTGEHFQAISGGVVLFNGTTKKKSVLEKWQMKHTFVTNSMKEKKNQSNHDRFFFVSERRT